MLSAVLKYKRTKLGLRRAKLSQVALSSLLAAMLMSVTFQAPASASSRIKDIIDFEGIRDNLLVGYGLVVGLNGSGDDLTNSAFTKQSLVGMLERLGVNTRDVTLKTKNVAAVMVTATLPSFSRQGTRIDVSVSALGDASSLLGGTLLVTPMVGADGEVYAVAQGQTAIGGFSASGKAASVTKNIPTSGRIANGAIVEREIKFDMRNLTKARLSLRNPDLTTARRVASAINRFLKRPAAETTDPGTIMLKVPKKYPGGVIALLTDIEQIRVAPDQLARVVVDEQNGIIVIGENVRISTLAIAQGNLTIKVTETPQVSQPNAFANTGTTQNVDRTGIDISEEKSSLAMLPTGVSLQELVNGLNTLGVGPRDMISILQTIKASGALQAEIQVL
ncbi:MAG: flagellar biosynthesis protein FlgA [Rhodospirillaceae bacterium]|nr:flagellar biosynthesis protein FlgA [Rhodospirillaceae bacterium]|tara:strand:+ start:97196 stop:98368 length:1173 start_codon:yes stop_codon:yes gene_type:complete